MVNMPAPALTSSESGRSRGTLTSTKVDTRPDPKKDGPKVSCCTCSSSTGARPPSRRTEPTRSPTPFVRVSSSGVSEIATIDAHDLCARRAFR